MHRFHSNDWQKVMHTNVDTNFLKSCDYYPSKSTPLIRPASAASYCRLTRSVPERSLMVTGVNSLLPLVETLGIDINFVFQVNHLIIRLSGSIVLRPFLSTIASLKGFSLSILHPCLQLVPAASGYLRRK